jgi:hypothetical protein
MAWNESKAQLIHVQELLECDEVFMRGDPGGTGGGDCGDDRCREGRANGGAASIPQRLLRPADNKAHCRSGRTGIGWGGTRQGCSNLSVFGEGTCPRASVGVLDVLVIKKLGHKTPKRSVPRFDGCDGFATCRPDAVDALEPPQKVGMGRIERADRSESCNDNQEAP